VLPTSLTAVIFAALLAAGELALNSRPTATRAAWLAWASTDLVNLRHHLLGCLVVSALVSDDHPVAWIVLALIGLLAAGQSLGNIRAALVVGAAHVLATAASEAILAVRISRGIEPVSERLLLDVGPSYVVVAGLVVGIVYGNVPSRIACGIAFVLLGPDLFAGFTSWQVSALGHSCAIVVAVALGYVCRRSWLRRFRPSGP
jgi:Rhomboid-like protein